MIDGDRSSRISAHESRLLPLGWAADFAALSNQQMVIDFKRVSLTLFKIFVAHYIVNRKLRGRMRFGKTLSCQRLCPYKWHFLLKKSTFQSVFEVYTICTRSRSACGLVISASPSVLVGRDFDFWPGLGSYQDLVNRHCILLTGRTVCGRTAGNTSRTQNKPEIVQAQSWRYKNMVVLQRQQQTTI